MIELKNINSNNLEDCFSLKVSVIDKNYVDDVGYSFAEAWLDYQNYRLFAINLQNKVIGFVSLYIGENHYQIINFLIDDSFQNKGYGRQAAKLVINYLITEFDAKMISLPVYQYNERAINFWQKLGFSISDNIEDDYIWLRLRLGN